jgi:hypothetical protein
LYSDSFDKSLPRQHQIVLLQATIKNAKFRAQALYASITAFIWLIFQCFEVQHNADAGWKSNFPGKPFACPDSTGQLDGATGNAFNSDGGYQQHIPINLFECGILFTEERKKRKTTPIITPRHMINALIANLLFFQEIH